MNKLVSDEEFIDTWMRLQSGSLVAKELNLKVRSVLQRRRNIEKTYKILLPVATSSNNGVVQPASIKMVMSERRDVNRLEIQNGSIIVGSDAHYSPGHISVAHRALCAVAAEISPVAVILNGDILDGGSIGRHSRQGWKKPPTVKQELEAVMDRLHEIEQAARGAKLMRTYGNHCMRFDAKLANLVPEYEGVPGMLLRDHIPGWKDSERIDINEDTVVIHDWHYGLHSGWNDVLKGGCNVITGHTHELSAKAHKGFKNTHYGIKTGMLADEYQSEFDYRLSKPGFNWQSGFVVLTWVNGMLLYPEFCAVRDDNNAYFRGKLVLSSR